MCGVGTKIDWLGGSQGQKRVDLTHNTMRRFVVGKNIVTDEPLLSCRFYQIRVLIGSLWPRSGLQTHLWYVDFKRLRVTSNVVPKDNVP